MIVVMASVRAKEGRGEELERALRGLVDESRKEATCIEYVLHRATDDARHFAFYERWESQEALGAHFETPHFKAVAARIPELCDGEPSIATFTVLA